MNSLKFTKTSDLYVKGHEGQLVRVVIYSDGSREFMFHFRIDVIAPTTISVIDTSDMDTLVQSVYSSVISASNVTYVQNCPLCDKPLYVDSNSIYCTNIQCPIHNANGMYRQSCAFGMDTVAEFEDVFDKYVVNMQTMPSCIFDVFFYALGAHDVSQDFKLQIAGKLREMTLSTLADIQGVPRGITEESISDMFVDINDIYIVLKTSVVTTGITSLVSIATTDTVASQYLISLLLNNVDILTKVAIVIADKS